MLARLLRSFCTDQRGATAIEYALIGTLIAVALVATFTVFGNAVGNLFNNASSDAIASQVDKLG